MKALRMGLVIGCLVALGLVLAGVLRESDSTFEKGIDFDAPSESQDRPSGEESLNQEEALQARQAVGTTVAQQERPKEQPTVRAAAPVIEVVSSLGLEIRRLQYSLGPDDPWVEVEETHVPSRAQRVRAAGHPEVAVAAPVKTLAIDSGATLTLRCEGLGSAVRETDLEAVFGDPKPIRAESGLLQPLGNDAVVLALDVSRWALMQRGTQGKVSVVLASGVLLGADWTPAAGEQRSVDLVFPVQWVQPTLGKLTLRESGAPEADRIERRITVRRTGKTVALNLINEPNLRIDAQSHWGSIDKVTQTGEMELDEVQTDAGYVVATWRRADGWYGRLSFSPLARRVPIPLHAPATLRGFVLESSGDPVHNAQLAVRFPDSSGSYGKADFWGGEWKDVVQEDGSFELVLPERVPPGEAWPGLPEVLPKTARVRINSPKHETFSAEIAMEAGSKTDLGEVVLERRPIDLVVRFDPSQVLESTSPYAVEWLGPDGTMVGNAIESLTLRAPGEWAVILEREEWDLVNPPDQIVVLADGMYMGASRSQGQYVGEPMTRIKARVDATELVPAPEYLRVRLRWSGFDLNVLRTRQAGVHGDALWIDILVPAEDCELSWSEKREGAFGEDRPLGPAGALPELIRLSR